MNPSCGDCRGQAKHCGKTIEMLQLFFLCPGTNPSDKPGFAKKTIFQALKDCFFGMPLAKPANSTSFDIALNCADRYIYIYYIYTHSTQLRSKNFRDPRPIVVDMCLH